MSKLLSTKDTVRFTPARDDGPTYLLRVPRPFEVPKMEIAITRLGTRAVSYSELLRAQADALRALLSEPQDAVLRTEWLDLIEHYLEGLVERPEKTFVALITDQTIARIGDLALRGNARYAELKAMQDDYHLDLGIEATRRFLIGIEGIDDPDLPRRSDGFLTDEAVDGVPQTDRLSIGYTIKGLAAPSEREAKNSDSPSPGDSSPGTSRSTTPEKTAAAKARPINRSNPTRGSSPKSASLN